MNNPEILTPAAKTAYIEAFNRCYPSHTVSIQPARVKRHETPRYNVVINDSAGDRSMTAQEIAEATKAFNV